MADNFEICTMCGEETDEMTVIDDETRVCEDCLENEFFYCDECGEYWLYDAVGCYTLSDDRTICEHCNKDNSDEQRLNYGREKNQHRSFLFSY